MEAKPILSTPVMELNPRHQEDYLHGGRLMLCVGEACHVFGLSRHAPPLRIRLLGFRRPARGRVCVQVVSHERPWHSCADIDCSIANEPFEYLYTRLGQCLLDSKALGPRLRAGKTVTVHVALEVVEDGP